MAKNQISISEPVTELRRVKIVEGGEPLVDYLDLCPTLVKAKPFFHYRYETVVRESVARMLCAASKALANGYRLGVLEGWRPEHIQRRMYLRAWNRFKDRHPDWSDVQLKRVVNRYVAPMNDRVPPPHSTGAAVDLFLLDADTNELDMREPFDVQDPKAFLFHANGLTDRARERRKLFADALLEGGLTNYPSEYWHWSFGDQGWAYRTGAAHAIYGVTEPVAYQPDPDDVTDDPVEFAGR
ncbi:MAG: dipeptidase [Armatimonadetes bacterium]|nr:dipeptidase [Armatimonadota bacterium]